VDGAVVRLKETVVEVNRLVIDLKGYAGEEHK
jgi:hypothetical protein